MKKLIQFSTYNVNFGDALVIVKEHLDDESIAIIPQAIPSNKLKTFILPLPPFHLYNVCISNTAPSKPLRKD